MSDTRLAVHVSEGQLANYKEKKFCDLILTAKENSSDQGSSSGNSPPSYSDAMSSDDIYCHKSVLAASSPYFDTILSVKTPGDGVRITKTQLPGNAYGMIVKSDGRNMVKIVLNDVDKDQLKPIIDYIYSGNISMSFGHVKQILRNAEKLKVDSLVKECKLFMRQKITASNCIPLLLTAQDMDLKDIEAAALEFFLDNIIRVCQLSSMEIKKLPLAVMKKLMNSEKLDETCVELAFRMLIIWADYDRERRSQHLHALMEPKIGLLSSEFLTKELANKEVVMSSQTSLQVVMTTLQFKQLSTS